MRYKNRLLYGFDEYVTAWVAERIPDVAAYGFTTGRAIGVLSDNGNKLIAGVIYHDYQPDYKTMQLSMASSNSMWARRAIIAELLAYPFIQLGVHKCWISIPSDNEKSLKTTQHIGFKKEGTLAHQFGKGRHAIMSRMFKEDFNRLYGDIYHGQVKSFPASTA